MPQGKKNANRCRLALKTLARKKKIMNLDDVSTPDNAIVSGSDVRPGGIAALWCREPRRPQRAPRSRFAQV